MRKSRKNSRVEVKPLESVIIVNTIFLQLSHSKPQSEETPQVETPQQQPQPQPPEPTDVTPPANNNFQQISDQHRLRISLRGKPTESSWDEDSAISQTSSTSGYRESYPVMHLRENLECSPKSFPPLASPDLHDLPSTSSATTTNLQCDNSSPDCSLNENGERTALLSHTERSSSQHSLLMVFEHQDETTLI